MATYTLAELKALIQDLGLNDNAKVAILVGQVDATHFQIVKVDLNGKVVTTT